MLLLKINNIGFILEDVNPVTTYLPPDKFILLSDKSIGLTE